MARGRFHTASSMSTLRTRLQLETLESRCLLSVRVGPLVQVSSLSPFANSNADNPPSQSGHVYINSETEPSVTADPNNPQHLVGAWQQDRWSNSGSRGMVTGVSFDGGNTWTISPVVGDTLVAGGVFQRTTDPWVSFAPNGTVYLATSPFNDANFNQAMFVRKSTDGGRTWGAPTTLIFETIPNAIDDKESVTADSTNARYAYYVWDRLFFDPNTFAFINGPTWFTRTTDGGKTWESARIIFDGGVNTQTIGNQIVVEPNGTLVDFFTFIDYNTGIESVGLVRSTDHGATWSNEVTVGEIQRINPTDPNTGGPLRTGEDIPAVAVDHNSGRLYAVWVDARFNGFTHNAVAMSTSKDGGLTWSAPIQVNQTPTNIPVGDQQAITPSVAVNDNGTVAVTYYDFRNHNGQTSSLPTDYWMVFATGNVTNPGSWGSETRVTTSSFNMELAPNVSGYFLGDYQGLAAGGHDNTSFAALFGEAVSSVDPSSIFFRWVKPSDNLTNSAVPVAALAATPNTLAAAPAVAPNGVGQHPLPSVQGGWLAAQPTTGTATSRLAAWEEVLDQVLQDAPSLGLSQDVIAGLTRADAWLDRFVP